MQEGRSRIAWASVFFACGALSAMIGYWTVIVSGVVPGRVLARGGVVSAVMLAAYVTVNVRVVRELRYASTPRLQAQVLVGAGIGLLLVSVALGLR